LSLESNVITIKPPGIWRTANIAVSFYLTFLLSRLGHRELLGNYSKLLQAGCPSSGHLLALPSAEENSKYWHHPWKSPTRSHPSLRHQRTAEERDAKSFTRQEGTDIRSIRRVMWPKLLTCFQKIPFYMRALLSLQR